MSTRLRLKLTPATSTTWRTLSSLDVSSARPSSSESTQAQIVFSLTIRSNRLLDAYFNRAFYKQILGRTVDMRDLESIDPEYHKSLQWMLDNDITGVIDVRDDASRISSLTLF